MTRENSCIRGDAGRRCRAATTLAASALLTVGALFSGCSEAAGPAADGVELFSGEILFSADSAGETALWTARPDGFGSRKLLGPVIVDELHVAPGQRRIATTVDRDVHVIDLDAGTGQRAFTLFGGVFEDWSLDGERLLYIREGVDRVRSIYSIRADGSDQRQHVLPIAGRLGRFRRIPGSERLVAWYQLDERIRIWTIDLAGPSFSPLFETDAHLQVGVPSPDGRQFAYVLSRESGLPTELRVIGLDGTGDRLVADADDLPSDLDGGLRYFHDARWSPDGTRIAFILGSSELWIVDDDGTGAALLAKFRPFGDQFVFSPDGSRIAYLASEDFPDRELRTVRTDGAGEPVRLVGDIGWRPMAVAWMP